MDLLKIHAYFMAKNLVVTILGALYGILGIIHGRKISRITLFGIVRKKTFTIHKKDDLEVALSCMARAIFHAGA